MNPAIWVSLLTPLFILFVVNINNKKEWQKYIITIIKNKKGKKKSIVLD